MKYLLDAVVILIFLLAIIIGHKRGFIKTVTGIVAFIAALAVAALLNGTVAALVYNNVIEPPLIETVEQQTAQAQGSAAEQLDSVYESLPTITKNLLTQAGIANGDDFTQNIPILSSSTSIAQSVASVVRSVLLPLLQAVCSLVLFVLAYILANILLRALNIIAKLPLLKQLNKSLGLIAGVLSGALWAMLAVTVLQIVAAFGAADSAINLSVLGDTVVVNWLSSINPLSGALQEVLNIHHQ